MDIRFRIGKNVRARIEKSGLSKSAFAKTYGFQRSLIHRILQGDANITVLQLEKLARALNVKPEKLIT